ncbi:hypothetical protein ONZ51_g11228 [Trametes cubensis]|uniref:Inhibitor of growth protein N-terminal histone-binding domain-containing protein n=1 Tax=Trametes cubensis TaxID=1111947 RepID=A0AAD7THZ3_9APHY|nr:hypothetical protein ONZ51_g11228 [Trametes cubensis]
MSTRRTKRRRLDFDGQDASDGMEGDFQREAEPTPAVESQQPSTESAQLEGPPPEEADAEASAKEREVWDAFREEHYELLEQLPLSLHRAFTLIQELDQQAQDNITHIAPAVLKYVALRKALAREAATENGAPDTDANAEAATDGPGNIPLPNGKIPNDTPVTPSPTATAAEPSRKRQVSSSTSSSLASAVESSTSTRELLIHLAQSSEEATRACAEKVYLAQHAYDLVDRYIRDLDRAIKEQEASITLGIRQGTHPASIILPEVVVPQSNQPFVEPPPPPPELPAEEPAEEGAEEELEPGEGQELEPEPEPEVDVEALEPETAPAIVPEAAAEVPQPAPSKAKKKGKKRKKTTSRKQGAAAEPEDDAAPTIVVEETVVPPAHPHVADTSTEQHTRSGLGGRHAARPQRASVLLLQSGLFWRRASRSLQ